MEWAPRPRSIEVDPPGPHAQTCNILYPRARLEEVGGFDESIRSAGEDLDLAARVRERGAPYVGAPDALTYHAVDTFSLLGAVRFNKRWETLPLVFKRHPQLREQLEYGVFWKRRARVPARGDRGRRAPQARAAARPARGSLRAARAAPPRLPSDGPAAGRRRAGRAGGGRRLGDVDDGEGQRPLPDPDAVSGPLRVALLNPCYFPEVKRGSERLIRELAGGLVAGGHSPDVDHEPPRAARPLAARTASR